MLRIPRVLASLLVITSLAVAVACGGDDGTASSTPTAAGENQRDDSTGTASPTATPGAPTGTPAADSPLAIAEDLSGGLSPLQKVSSFNYAVDVAFESKGGDKDESGSVTLSGSYRGPDRFSLKLKLDAPGMPVDIQAIGIGNDLYTNLGGAWEKVAANDAGLLSSLLSTNEDFYREFTLKGLGDLGGFTVEDLNGIRVKHYRLDQDDLQKLATEAGQGDVVQSLLSAGDLAMDLFLADAGGFLVGLRLDGTLNNKLPGTGLPALGNGTVELHVKMDLTDLDDPNITIEPPI